MIRFRPVLHALLLALCGGRPVLAQSLANPGAIGYGRRSSGLTAPTRGGSRPWQIGFEGFGRPGWTDGEVASMGAGSRAGARGLEVHKSLCLGRRDAEGKLIAVDDPRIDPLWEFCG